MTNLKINENMSLRLQTCFYYALWSCHEERAEASGDQKLNPLREDRQATVTDPTLDR